MIFEPLFLKSFIFDERSLGPNDREYGPADDCF